MLVFLIVLYMLSYRWVHFSTAVLFYELNLFLFFKAASFLFSLFFLQPTVQQGYPNGNSLLAKHCTHTVHAHEKATFSSLRSRIVHLGTVHFLDAEQVYTRDILKQEALVISKNVEKTTTKNTKTNLEPSLNLCYPVSYTKDAHKIISLSS